MSGYPDGLSQRLFDDSHMDGPECRACGGVTDHDEECDDMLPEREALPVEFAANVGGGVTKK